MGWVRSHLVGDGTRKQGKEICSLGGCCVSRDSKLAEKHK